MLLTTCFLICSDWKKSQKKVEKGNEQVNPEGSPCAVVSLIIRLFGVVRYKKEDEVYSSLYLIPWVTHNVIILFTIMKIHIC